MILTETLKKAHKFFPNKQAIVCGGNRWTYGEFFDRINRLSHFLRSLGMRKDDKVAILHPNCHTFLEAYYGTAQMGAISVPINYRLSPKEIAFILRDSESKILIADPMFQKIVDSIREEVPGIGKILWTGEGIGRKESRDLNYEGALQEANSDAIHDVDINDEDTAQIYYTSGTTGRPKGVMLSHKNVTLHALGTIAEIHLIDRDVWIHVAPLFHLADAWATWAITWVGGTHVLVREFAPQTVLETIEREKVTLTNLIPTMLNLMVNHPDVGKYDYSSLRVLLSGGAPIAPEVVRKIVETFKCDYIQTYGMTETSPYLTLSILKDHLKKLSKEDQLRFKSKTGREFIGVELKVINDREGEVKKDEKEVGEIIVKGDIVTKGYWKLPDETKKSIKDGWLYTGDNAYMDEDGYFHFVDRKKDMIKRGGENVAAVEVEYLISLHPKVQEVAVVGVPDPIRDEAIMALVVLKAGETSDADEIINFCKERLAKFKVPSFVEFKESFPKTSIGKVQKNILRKEAMEKFEHK